MPGEFWSVPLQDVVRDVIARLAPPTTIQICIEHDLPVVQGEWRRWHQVFTHLLSNAVKFLDASSGRVRIGRRDDKTTWTCWVDDTGPGIDLKYHEKIFQIFQTLTPRDEQENIGIGLSSVKKIVELYGGKIWVESAPGQESTFFLTVLKEDTVGCILKVLQIDYSLRFLQMRSISF